jgi:hypothetical protein
VLDHDPDHPDIKAFFHRFRMALRLRSLKLKGITTDGSLCIRTLCAMSSATSPIRSANSMSSKN